MSMQKKQWTRNELILAYNLYCKTPFTKINARNKGVINLSELLGRSASAVALKLANFARLDPDLQNRNIRGMRHGSKAEVSIWQEFHSNWEDLSFESEQLLSSKESIPSRFTQMEETLFHLGEERKVLIKQRINQNFFRQMVLASYDNKCCITGSNSICLLTACHIKPWKTDSENRLNPRNGLCMNTLFHSAFDAGLLTITTNFKILLSPQIKASNDSFIKDIFARYNEKSIILPQRFFPAEEFLAYHNKYIFLS